MERNTWRLIGIAIFIVVLAVGLVSLAAGIRDKGETFNGSRVRNPDEYLLDFSSMSQEDEHTLHMESGDVLQVFFAIEKGNVDVAIGIEGQAAVYSGNSVEKADFELLIEETGDYTISINARKATGKMEFIVEGQ